MNVIDDLRRNLDMKNISIAVLFDFSKAFDRVDHELLLYKLKKYFYFDSTACALVLSYLSNRVQEVHTNTVSSKLEVISGVPQGSVLGPILFSMYINDLPINLKFTDYHLYADDLQIYSSDKRESLANLVDKLNIDIDAICTWALSNGFKLNTSKTQCILLSNKKIDVAGVPKIRVNGVAINYSDHVKSLGIYLDGQLKFDKHVSEIRRKVTFSLRKLWSLSSFADVLLKKKLFHIYILPYFLYCHSSFLGLSNKQFSRLNLAFNSCIRYVHKLNKFDHISMYKTSLLGSDLNTFYDMHTVLLIYKILRNKRPTYLFSKFSYLRSKRTSNMLIPKNRSKILNSSFFARGVGLWNSLPSDVKSSESCNIFRKECRKHYRILEV